MSKVSILAGCLGVLAMLGTVPAQAAEEVTLRNGFNLLCDHREQAGDRVRLFTSQGSGNFVEVDAAEIASVDMVPDPPAAPVTTATLLVVTGPGICPTLERRYPAIKRD